MQPAFTKLLLQWHKKNNKRTMPWKGIKDPYKIWLAEIILQQTRVEQGLPYYNKFISSYPTIVDLANANDNEVFKLWEGLGYYSRCRNLLHTARKVRDEYNGNFPANYEQIIALKGVGSYTAAAIVSFAYNLPYAVVDGNVYRVLSRFYNSSIPIDSLAGKKYFSNLAQELLSVNEAANFNQAIMDFGATVCLPKNPSCSNCKLQKHCKGFANNTIHQLPIKEKRLQKKHRFFYFFVLRFHDKIFIQKREKDIWQNLYQFLLIEKDEPQLLTKANVYSLLGGYFQPNNCSIVSVSKTNKQLLTHQKIEGNFIEVSLKKIPENFLENGIWVNESDLKNYAFPKFINHYLVK